MQASKQATKITLGEICRACADDPGRMIHPTCLLHQQGHMAEALPAGPHNARQA